ncbi:AcrR family transcriptional regulator [Cytobacillus eiseniae]|uniref:AcrR family transcriptional regulator n=1 Tax=Cytobacillus eiseniae TaxID=762947 RepID=A0ABS4RFW6_9BACI|nr:TetR/AcrR family transcriptional regulator [Cytobacillus eiseniae]MBP2241795.1 AcrR family transcriptional regulator [Cytobacillus eiseniae]
MAPLNEDQLENIRNERKIQIMRAAIKVFATHGFKLTKISLIAKEAGISHGLVYHYFKSKEEVLYDSLEWAMELNETRKFLTELSEMAISPVEKLHKFTKFALSSSLSTSSDIFRIIQHLEHTEGVPDHLLEFTKNVGMMYVEFFIPIFIEGQKAGEIIQEDPEVLVGIFLTIISGVMADDPGWWQENMDHKIAIYLRMLTTR